MKARRQSFWKVSVASVAAVALTFVAIPGASAEEGHDPSNIGAIGAAEAIVPEIVAETVVDGFASVAETDSAPSVIVDGLDYVEGQSPGIEFSVDYGTDVIGEVDGITVLETSSELVEALVQPTSAGVRVLTVIADASAPTSYDYTFDVPVGTTLTASDQLYYIESGEDILGSLRLPWAVDADGDPVPTTYSWEGATLTQHVDLSHAGIDYPVVADPAWGYTYSYNVKWTASKNSMLLRSCFNCYFPVSGAPRAFPSPGQILPLRVAGFNFECKFKSTFTGTNYFGFQFDATRNHVDGLGSNIVSEFRTVGGVKKLVVSAYIVNDAMWLNSPVYRGGALANWATFASNLNNAY